MKWRRKKKKKRGKGRGDGKRHGREIKTAPSFMIYNPVAEVTKV